MAAHPRVLVEMMGFEPMTPCLQGRCSPNWATPPYSSEEWRVKSEEFFLPSFFHFHSLLFLGLSHIFASLSKILQNWTTNTKRTCNSTRWQLTSCLLVSILHRKEVIQPHLPIRLPCYDLTPIIEPTFDHCLLAVSSWASGVPNFHGLTGGVYKARERIHRGMLIRDY